MVCIGAFGRPDFLLIRIAWQVTGVRQDAYANENRMQVEVKKRPDEQGKYLHPLEHGVSETKGLYYDMLHDRTASQKAER